MKNLISLFILMVISFSGCAKSDSSAVDTYKSNTQAQSSEQPKPTLNGWNPELACNYLSDISGLQTRGYKNQYENTFGCSSPYKELGGGSLLPNNIAYYVGGNAQNANELKLVLNVNTGRSTKEAHSTLLQYGKQLTQKALNEPMPKGAETAITQGKSGKWSIGKATVELVREDWGTGKGYDLKYFLRK